MDKFKYINREDLLYDFIGGHKIMCDTGIMSRFLTLHDEKIVEKVEKIGLKNIVISIVTRIELFNWLSGYKNLDKSLRAKLFKRIKDIEVVPLTKGISNIAFDITNKYHNSAPSDTFIGASAVYFQLPLYTLNKKHFKQIKDLELYE